MDIHLCIDHLGLNRNTYRLTRSVPPHEFIEWNGPDTQPTQAALESAWAEIQADSNYKIHLSDPINNRYPV